MAGVKEAQEDSGEAGKKVNENLEEQGSASQGRQGVTIIVTINDYYSPRSLEILFFIIIKLIFKIKTKNPWN